MSYEVDFKDVATTGLETAVDPAALAGLRANEARYFWNKYKQTFVTDPASETPDRIALINKILLEKGLHLAAKPLETASFVVEDTRWLYVFYQDGLSLNVLYTLKDDKKRAVGIKLSDGMQVPAEFEGKFKFARQKSKLAGTIRGSYFVIKQTYTFPD